MPGDSLAARTSAIFPNLGKRNQWAPKIELDYPFASLDELVKSLQKDDFLKSSRCKARKNCGVRSLRGIAPKGPQMKRRRWAFYEVISFY
jgi:hypothetical protein